MPALPPLPELSDEDLFAFFGDDIDGLRRYRLMHAVLVEGMTQREAADAHASSERTVRNILRSFSASGMEALRSRRLPAQRSSTQAEQALAAALAQEPQGGGDRLWRLAQELIGPDGATLSRRTAYRILARLRASEEEEEEEQDAPNSLRGLVRSALPLLAEDPPLALGASALAQRLLPDEDEPLLGGMLIQQAIRDALDNLRPPGAVSTIDRSWWPYLICTGEYEAGQRRADLQENLALSASTYSRAKRQGIDTITALLPQIIQEKTEGQALLASQRLPRTPDFVGRRDEESYYAWRLQTEGIAHIWGLPGSGKTALAAELAAEGARYGQTILWHTCNPGPDATLIGLLRGLGKAFAATGDDTLWRETRRLPSDQQDLSALIDLLRERLLLHPSVVVLDDIHRLTSHDADQLYDALADLIACRSTRLLLIGRGRIESLSYPPLLGLSERDARLLLGSKPAFSSELWWAIYESTGGVPELLRLVIAVYRRSGDQTRPEDWIAEVSTWAREKIWNRLSASEQRLLTVAHLLAPQPWASQAEPVCEALNIPPETFAALCNRALLTINRSAVTVFGALRFPIEAQLHEKTQLREEIIALAADLPVEQAPAATDECEAAEPGEYLNAITSGDEGSAEAVVPAGLELLTRVRKALQVSMAYMQEHPDSTLARQIAAQLASLQSALPDPSGPPTPLARTLGEPPQPPEQNKG